VAGRQCGNYAIRGTEPPRCFHHFAPDVNTGLKFPGVTGLKFPR